MESMKKSESSETRPKDQNEKEEDRQSQYLHDTGDIQEKMKKVEVKTCSPTSLLAKNSLLLPTGIIGPSERDAKTKRKTVSSASATGKNVISIDIIFQDQSEYGDVIRSEKRSKLSNETHKILHVDYDVIHF